MTTSEATLGRVIAAHVLSTTITIHPPRRRVSPSAVALILGLIIFAVVYGHAAYTVWGA